MMSAVKELREQLVREIEQRQELLNGLNRVFPVYLPEAPPSLRDDPAVAARNNHGIARMNTDKKKTKRRSSSQPILDRGDHEVIRFGGRLIPVLGTVGGTPAESRETAMNIERFLGRTKK
jgi:hypothetical protein